MRYQDDRVDAPVFRKVQAVGMSPDFRNNFKWTGSLLVIFSWWVARQMVSAMQAKVYVITYLEFQGIIILIVSFFSTGGSE